MDGLLILSGIAALLFVLAIWRLLHQLKRKRLLSGLAWSMQSLLVFAVFAAVLLVYSNLLTYQRLTYEAVIADVYLRELAPRKYQLSLELSDKDDDQHYYVLEGDQWQLDARILKWKGWANLIGLDSYYQLDRLSSRYRDIAEASQRIPSLYDLRQTSRGLDVWKLKQLLRDKLTFVDTQFGQGVYMPMVDGGHYRISVGQGGMIVRAANEKAKAAGFE
jgi:hypothetical protein